MVPAIERSMDLSMAPKVLIIVRPNGACVNELVDGCGAHRAIVIPCAIQIDEHVGFCSVKADGSNETALRCFGTYKSSKANWCVPVFYGDTFRESGSTASIQ